MEKQWYLEREGKLIGPLTVQELRERAEAGRITPKTQIRKGTDGPWVFAEAYEKLLEGIPDKPPLAKEKKPAADDVPEYIAFVAAVKAYLADVKLKPIHSVLIVFVWTVVSFLFGCGVGWYASAKVQRRQQDEEVQETISDADAYRDTANKEAGAVVAHAERRANEIMQAARDEAEGHLLRYNKQMHKLYPNLKEYRRGTNVVNQKYVKSFSVSGNEISVVVENRGNTRVKPGIDIVFIDRYGFVTEVHQISWWTSMSPGERRVDKGFVEFRGGVPVYYRIRFHYRMFEQE